VPRRRDRPAVGVATRQRRGAGLAVACLRRELVDSSVEWSHQPDAHLRDLWGDLSGEADRRSVLLRPVPQSRLTPRRGRSGRRCHRWDILPVARLSAPPSASGARRFGTERRALHVLRGYHRRSPCQGARPRLRRACRLTRGPPKSSIQLGVGAIPVDGTSMKNVTKACAALAMQGSMLGSWGCASDTVPRTSPPEYEQYELASAAREISLAANELAVNIARSPLSTEWKR
jgi:hypothetical protein